MSIIGIVRKDDYFLRSFMIAIQIYIYFSHVSYVIH